MKRNGSRCSTSRLRSHSRPSTHFCRQAFTARVQDIAGDGRGVITHPDGRICFVPGVWLGEEGEFQLTAVKGRTGSAKLLSLNRSSAARVVAPCRYHGHGERDCGGCAWQFVDYQAQLTAKQARVEKVLGSLCRPDVIKPIWGSTQTFGYRNRAQFKTDGEHLGYLAAGSHRIVDVESCPILTEANQQTLSQLRLKLPSRNWLPARHRSWVTLDIDETVCADNASVNERLPFIQANDWQNQRMKEWLRRQAASLPCVEPAIELFCGSGNFTEVLAQMGFASILAVEVAGEALERLAQKQLPNVFTMGADLYRESALDTVIKRQPEAKTLILDPPRDGLKQREPLLKKPKASKGISDIVYISCDLATLTRDLTDFIGAGYKLLEVQPLDPFPHTPHIELLTRLHR